jgi:predicted kinase
MRGRRGRVQRARAKMPTKSKGKIILAVGLPGSGKSTYFAKRGIHPLSSDTLRLWLLDDATNQRHQAEVFAALRKLLKVRLSLGMARNYIDATSLTPSERRPYFRLAERYGYEMEAIYFDVPWEVCRRRNRARNRRVPEEAMRKLAKKLSPPTREEGFRKITIVRPGRKPGRVPGRMKDA